MIMRHPIVMITCLGLTSPILFADEEKTLTDEQDRISYAIGHQIGVDFKRQNVDLDTQAITQGMVDGHIGEKPQLSSQEMNHRLVNLKKRITDDAKAKAMERMQKREAEMKSKRQIGKEFLAENANKPGITTTESGMQYRIINPGTGSSPQLNDQVKINYKSTRLDGKLINSSELKGGPRTFPVNRLLPGMIEAIRMMQPGAKWELFLPEKMAFARRGPYAHETIIVELELLEIVPATTAQLESPEEKSSEGDSKDGERE
jgi:FKBP-type peptidyl-prolyl cis-trans isomerase FklB